MPTEPDKLIEITRSTKSQTDQKMIAEALVGMPIQAAMTVTTYLQAPFNECMSELMGELAKQMMAVNKEDMSNSEGLLMAQAYSLDAIYNRLAQRAMSQEYIDHFEKISKLAFRAQNQCARTLEVLSAVKNPHNVAFVKQANIAHNQQVNNGTQAGPLPAASPPPIIDSTSTAQLEQIDGHYLDTGTAPAASGNDSAMATVGEIHRPENRRRQG